VKRALLLLAVVACERPRAYVLCHNANCTGSDPSRDDTMPALRESLALRWNRQPLIDGIELDTFWDMAGERCTFAHDAGSAAVAVLATEAANEVAAHLRETASLVGERPFFIKHEMKPTAPSRFDAHTDCALDMFDIIAGAAVETDRRVTVFFESEDPRLVAHLVGRPRYPGSRAGERLQTGLVVPFNASPPRDLAIDAVTIEAALVTPERQAALRELRVRDIDLIVWMYDADVAVLDAIEDARPKFVNTNEAALLREWLGSPPDDL